MSTAKSPIDKPKSQGGVQSLEIGLTILDVLINRNEPMMLKDIASAVQMNPAKVHRYLVSLIRKEFACQVGDGRYGVGARVSALGHTGLNPNDTFTRLVQAAKDISDALGCGVQIAKWFSEGPIVIHSVDPDSPISIITRIGSRMPLATSATGRLFASYRPLQQIKPLLEAEFCQMDTARTNMSSSDMFSTNMSQKQAWQEKSWQEHVQMMTRIRQQGYAMVAGDMLMGVNAISVPVNAGHERYHLEYAITVIGTTEQLPKQRTLEIMAMIKTIIARHQVG